MIGSVIVESFAYVGRLMDSRYLHERAYLRSLRIGRPLVVVGDRPRFAAQFSCGDHHFAPSGCKKCGAAAFIGHERLPLDNDSVVVFAPYALERVGDPTFDPKGPQRAYDELVRVAGDEANVFVARIQPYATGARLASRVPWMVTSAPPDGPFRYHAVVRERRRVR